MVLDWYHTDAHNLKDVPSCVSYLKSLVMGPIHDKPIFIHHIYVDIIRDDQQCFIHRNSYLSSHFHVKDLGSL